MHEKFVHVVVEVGVSHEWWSSILWQIAAYTGRVAAGTSIKHDAELVVVDVVSVAADLAEIVLHVDGQLELGLDDSDESVLWNSAFLRGQSSEGHERVH